MPRPTPDDEIRRIRAIIDRQGLPDLLVSYDVRLDEFDDYPAIMIKMFVRPQADLSQEGAIAYGDALVDLSMPVRKALLDEMLGRFPYVSFAEATDGRTAD